MTVQQIFYNLPRNRLRRRADGARFAQEGRLLQGTDGQGAADALCLFAPGFAAPARLAEERHRHRLLRCSKTAASGSRREAFRAFLDGGRAPVYIGFGSMPFGAERNTQILKDAVKLWGGRAVVARGWGGINPDDLPSQHLRHREGAARQAVQICAARGASRRRRHDGGGAEPGQADLHRAADGRPAVLGLGVCTSSAADPADPPARLTPEMLAAALRDLSTNLGYSEKASAMGAALRAEDGTGNAVREIERVMARSPRTTTPVPSPRHNYNRDLDDGEKPGERRKPIASALACPARRSALP